MKKNHNTKAKVSKKLRQEIGQYAGKYSIQKAVQKYAKFNLSYGNVHNYFRRYGNTEAEKTPDIAIPKQDTLRKNKHLPTHQQIKIAQDLNKNSELVKYTVDELKKADDKMDMQNCIITLVNLIPSENDQIKKMVKRLIWEL